MKKQIWLIAAIALTFAVIGIYFGAEKYKPAATAADPMQTLFAQTMPVAAGDIQRLDKWKGKVLLVNFWATWCPPCVEEMPELSTLQAELKQKNFQVIGIGVDSPENILAFTTKHKIDYPLYQAGMGGGELSRQLGNKNGGLPFSLLIGADGRIKQTYLGRLHMETVRRDLASFL